MSQHDFSIDEPDANSSPQPVTPAKTTTGKADPHLIRGLQGEDGFEVFNDDKAGDTLERLRREHEDSRW